jgi:hypothetical protein
MKLKLAPRTKDGILVVDCSGRIVLGEESSLLRDTVKKAVSENSQRRSLSKASWSEERCRKSRPQMAQFRLCWFGMLYRRE